jgi:polyhydroxyalkanoate synthase
MSSIYGDKIIENIKKASIYYQEIIMHLSQNQSTNFSSIFYENNKSQEIATKLFEQFFEHPEKFTEINLEYIHNLQELITNSVAKFTGKQSEDLQNDKSFFDKRFKDPAWQQSVYFDFIRKYYMISANWTKNTIKQYELDSDTKRFLEFTSNRFVEALSPSNFIFSNPEVIKESLDTGMSNITKGMENFLMDLKKSDGLINISTTDKSYFKVGENLATTKGKVIFQNDLIQLICYKPKKTTHAIPIFIIPPWINKYYIMDLSKENSLIKWLVDNNFQVFLASWVNPTKDLAHKDFEDYLQEGIIEPLEYIKTLGFSKVNTVGYCIGGTLLAIAISYYKSNNNTIINSASFFTTLLDFSNPGEIGALINKSTIDYIENKVSEVGYLDKNYLTNSFSLIRANDLVWSYFVNNYLLGKSPAAFDILYWNSDATNLPAKMYIYYLKNMYIDNLLKIPNNIKMLGTKINLDNIDIPTFSLAAKADHIALWQSVYDGIKLFKGNRTFCLTEAGHVTGVINPATSYKYPHMISTDIVENPNEWLESAKIQKDSWWNSWNKWLCSNSKELTKSINYNSIHMIENAPGSYVCK